MTLTFRDHVWYGIRVELDDVTNNKTMTIAVNMKQAYMASPCASVEHQMLILSVIEMQ